MAKSRNLVPVCEVVDQVSLGDLCRICAASADWVIALVDEGILEPDGPDRTRWRFDSVSITIVRKVQRLQSDLDVNIPGIALVLSLVAENAQLKRRVDVLEQTWPVVIPMPGP